MDDKKTKPQKCEAKTTKRAWDNPLAPMANCSKVGTETCVLCGTYRCKVHMKKHQCKGMDKVTT